MSLPEALLWRELRGEKLGFKVRRQHPIGPYVVDFYVRHGCLVIEVDGEAHNRGDRPTRDARRDLYLAERGHRILRFAASDVMNNLEGVLTIISERVTNPLHHPSDGPPPHAGEDHG
jgi:very-short-patch-repair endonuclease